MLVEKLAEIIHTLNECEKNVDGETFYFIHTVIEYNLVHSSGLEKEEKGNCINKAYK